MSKQARLTERFTHFLLLVCSEMATYIWWVVHLRMYVMPRGMGAEAVFKNNNARLGFLKAHIFVESVLERMAL